MQKFQLYLLEHLKRKCCIKSIETDSENVWTRDLIWMHHREVDKEWKFIVERVVALSMESSIQS